MNYYNVRLNGFSGYSKAPDPVTAAKQLLAANPTYQYKGIVVNAMGQNVDVVYDYLVLDDRVHVIQVTEQYLEKIGIVVGHAPVWY